MEPSTIRVRRAAHGITQGALFSAALCLAAVSTLMAPATVEASGATVPLDDPQIDYDSKESLQRGAQAFVNYCMGCHNAEYARYNRVAKDIGLSEEEMVENLVFTSDEAGEPTKVGSLMSIAMDKEYSEQAFGVAPPNLALTARSRGADWIYTYLRSYYDDPSRAATGVNNLVYAGTAMPNVLWSLQGTQVPIYKEHDGEKHIIGLKSLGDGELSEQEFDRLAGDITNFLVYLADPVRSTRHRIGYWVLSFLLGLFVLSYFLKKEYWKDVVWD